MTTELRVSVRNDSDFGGTALTPFFTGFHDNSFDIYNLGEASSPGLEALAEDGNNDVIVAELAAADGDAQSVNVAGANGPIDTRELAATTITVNGASNGYVAFASMLLPSNDAFVGTADAVQLFDDAGNFLGAQEFDLNGTEVRDAGTEVNTELDAAFINQTAPDTGETEDGVVTIHPGFNGSEGNPEGEQIILGGTNAFGNFIDPEAADFTREGAQIATVHINTVARQEGSDRSDVLLGARDDDFIDGGAGADIIIGGRGWDVLNGEGGRDFVHGGAGDDVIDGGAGRDLLFGGRGNDDVNGGGGRDFIVGGAGNDNLSGDAGRDFILGGGGNDAISGGAGRDYLNGGGGDDVFVFGVGSDVDVIKDFDQRGDDRIALSFEGIETFEDVLGVARDLRDGQVQLNFGDGDRLVLIGTETEDLTSEDFLFL